jgi:hypothetical protein
LRNNFSNSESNICIRIKIKDDSIIVSDNYLFIKFDKKITKLKDLIDIKKIKLQLVKLCNNNDITIIEDDYNIDSENILCLIFFVGIMKNMHVLEYDMNNKKIIDNYLLIDGYSIYESHSFGKITFENDGKYLNIVCPNKHFVIKYKKSSE